MADGAGYLFITTCVSLHVPVKKLLHVLERTLDMDRGWVSRGDRLPA